MAVMRSLLRVRHRREIVRACDTVTTVGAERLTFPVTGARRWPIQADVGARVCVDWVVKLHCSADESVAYQSDCFPIRIRIPTYTSVRGTTIIGASRNIGSPFSPILC